jgi:hypothetical protein
VPACSAPRHQLRGFAGDGREHVFDLVEQQRHACALPFRNTWLICSER